MTSARPAAAAKDGERRPGEGEVETGDIVRLSASGRLVKVEPKPAGEDASTADAAREGDRTPQAAERRPVFKALRSGGTSGRGGRELADHELRELEQLRQRDEEVRAHELAHKSAAGSHAGAISLSYRTGPDGQRYAVAGEVPVDLSPVRGDPAATVRKMTQIRQAALAPADPSAADRAAASQATALMQKAQADLTEVQARRLEAARTDARPRAESGEAPGDAGSAGGVDGQRPDPSGASDAAADVEKGDLAAASAVSTSLRFYARG